MLIVAPANADNYPSRHITLIAPWPPGGGIDTLCRELSPGVSDLLGQPVIVQNRPGAGSTIGTAEGAKAPPDGYTLVIADIGSLAISPTLYKALPYDPRKDFAPIALIARAPFVLVINPSLPVMSVADLIGYAKVHPGALTYGSGGAGSLHQLFAEMFEKMAGIEMMHVPYKGSVPALADVIGGHISLMFTDPASALPMVKTGKVRALGVTTAARLPSAPDIPPLAEAGAAGFDAAGWAMVVAPAHTPAPIVTRLYDAFRAVEARSDIHDRMTLLGLALQSAPPDALKAFIDGEIVRWGKVVKAAGLAGTE